MKLNRSLLILASSALLGVSHAQAATHTFTVPDAFTTGTGNWSTDTKWNSVPVSDPTTSLIFTLQATGNSQTQTTGAVNDIATANPNSAFQLNTMTFNSNPSAANGSSVVALTVSGNPLDFVSNGGTTPQINLNGNRTAGQPVTFTVSSDVVLTNDTLFTGTGTAAFTVSGGISGAGILTKGGSSALSLSGAISSTGGLVMNAGSLTLSNASNSYIGGTSINAGTLSVSSTGTLGSNVITNNISLAAGARLDLSAAGNTGANQTITLTSTAGSLATLALGYNGVPNATIAQADTNGGLIALNAVTGFTGNLTTALTGKNLFLGSIGTSTFTGTAATLAAGTGSTYRLGGGGGSISFNTANQITGANSVQIGSTATGGTGTVIFGAAQDYSGGTTITAGSTLRFDTLASMPAVGTVTVADGAILGVTVAGTATTWGSGTGVAGIAGLTSTGNSGEGYGGQTGAVVNFDGNSFLNLNVTAAVTESNAIGNGTATSIGLIKSGASALTLTGDNTYSGGTTLSAGTLNINNGGSSSSNSAIGTGTFTISGGTIDNTSGAAASTLTLATNNALALNGDFVYTGTGSRNLNLGTGAVTMAATRSITVTAGTLTIGGNIASTTAGITKAGVGILNLTGNNSYSGTTTINAGSVVLNNGGDVTGSAVTFGGSNTGLTVTGGSAVTSIWNLNGGNFGTSNASLSNIQVRIDGAGTAGSARVTNVGTLVWGRTAANSTLLLTNGGQMNVNGAVRIGNPYYLSGTPPVAGNTNLTIEGGAANSTFTGNGASTPFYIGYGERTGSKDNIVTVSAGGILTNIGHMVIGSILDAQNGDYVSTGNKLVVTGGGTASVASISLGFVETANAARRANANALEVTNGGALSSSGIVYVGRANIANSTSSANTLTVGGTGSSSWNAGGQAVNVGFTNNIASAISNDNILTVGAGGTVTNVGTLTVGSATAGTSTGNQLVVNGMLTASTVTISANNSLSGSGTINAPVTVNGTYSPGQSPGTMTFQNILTLAASSSTVIEIDGMNGAGATGGHDFTNLTGAGAAGALTYGGTMTVDIGVLFGAGAYSWDLFDFASETGGLTGITLADQYSGSLTESALGSGAWGLTSGENTWSFTESTGVLGLTVVPEPNVAALLGGFAALLLIRRKR